MSNDIEKKVIDIIDLILEEPGVKDFFEENDDLLQFGIDSISFIKIIVAIEDEFKIEFEDDHLDFTKFASKKTLCNSIERLVSLQEV